MTWLNVIYMILGILSILITTVLPLGYKLVKSVKALKEAKTEADKERAFNDMLIQAQSLIQAAETAFADIDKAGAKKKEDVVSHLQEYALSNGYEYDAEFWSAKIDEIVAFTREVNAHN